MVSVPARRTQVTFATGRGLSQRRACTLLSVARSALCYRSRKAEKDAPVLARMRELAASIRAMATGASASFSAVTVTR
jgi:putative transposase